MLKCNENHDHAYWFKVRICDDFEMVTRFLRTWESAKSYTENLGCECCTLAPPIETLEQGKLYEIGYCGSFRFMGCVAEGKKYWYDDSNGTSETEDTGIQAQTGSEPTP